MSLMIQSSAMGYELSVHFLPNMYIILLNHICICGPLCEGAGACALRSYKAAFKKSVLCRLLFFLFFTLRGPCNCCEEHKAFQR